MRSIRGYIKNLFDGLGPPPGSVHVHAFPVETGETELALDTHRLGALDRVHLSHGSGSPQLADGDGRFGWTMELAPGNINVQVNPTDPQNEQRRRYPDESAQIGKGFISDIERLGWAGGRDHLIWDAVFDGHRPTPAQWSTDPAASWKLGNGSIASVGTGTDAGRLTIRQFIAMLGGVPFSVEMGDLLIPVQGEPAMAANGSASDRWDLICIKIDWNRNSPSYGKQAFEIIPGSPGAPPVVPTVIPNGTDNYRRLPLHAIKMKAGQSTYTYDEGLDLRSWASPPAGVVPQTIARSWHRWAGTHGIQSLLQGWNESTINATLIGEWITLPLGVAWDGFISWNAQLVTGAGTVNLQLEVSTQGRRSAAEGALANTNFAVPTGFAPVLANANQTEPGTEISSYVFPLRRIPAHHAGDAFASEDRDWTQFRPNLRYYLSGGAFCNIASQNLAIVLWPVR